MADPISMMDEEATLADLLERFPVLSDPVAEEMASWQPEHGLMLHLIWDVMFHVLFLPMMESEAEDSVALQSFFDWMEDTLLRGDKHVVNWIDTGILERFGDDLSWVKRSRPYMGPLTIQHHRMVQSWWGRDDGFYDLGPPGRPPFTGFPHSPSARPWTPPRG
jgi:hypothetical protein